MKEKLNNKMATLHITQHKRFVPYGTHPNPAFGGTSFMLETLCESGAPDFSFLPAGVLPRRVMT
jgi:hypothetical protein